MSTPWFADVPPTGIAGVWQISNNSGGVYNPYTPGVTVPQVVGPTGTQRIRRAFTLPAADVGKVVYVTWSGDIHAVPPSIPGQLYVNGVQVGTATAPGASGSAQFQLPLVAGVYFFEIWVGQANIAGNTRLDSATMAFADVSPPEPLDPPDATGPFPCDCCPSVDVACALVSTRFTAVAQTVAAAGWTPTALALTIDGITATAAISGYSSPAGDPPAGGTPTVRYTMSPARNNVVGVRLWNNAGGVLNDLDGLGPTTTVTFFDAALNVLFTGPLNAGNGGAPFTTVTPNIDGVAFVELSTLDKQQAGLVAPLWREFQLLNIEYVFPCRRPSGVLEWYDSNGNLVPTADVGVACAPEPTPISPATFVMDGFFFGDGPDPLGEQICNVVPVPTGTVNFGPLVGACYDPTVPGNVQMTWTNPNSVTLEYGNPPQTSGGVIVQFTSADLGGLITWPTNNNGMSLGEVRQSNPGFMGRYATITYISGPAIIPNGSHPNAPRMAGGGGGAQINLHIASTDNTTPPVRFRLDFYQP